MSDVDDAQIRSVLEDVRSGGPGNHAHLDELLGAAAPPPGDPHWVDVSRQVAEVAARVAGRFIVAVPLRSSQDLPLEVQLSAITALDPLEPPAVHHVLDHDPPRTWTGEYFRLDLVESTQDLLVYVSAFRSLEEREEAAPFDIKLYFETR